VGSEAAGAARTFVEHPHAAHAVEHPVVCHHVHHAPVDPDPNGPALHPHLVGQGGLGGGIVNATRSSKHKRLRLLGDRRARVHVVARGEHADAEHRRGAFDLEEGGDAAADRDRVDGVVKDQTKSVVRAGLLLGVPRVLAVENAPAAHHVREARADGAKEERGEEGEGGEGGKDGERGGGERCGRCARREHAPCARRRRVRHGRRGAGLHDGPRR